MTRAGTLFFVLPLAVFIFGAGLGGCASVATKPRTCAMILLIEGKHMHPSVKQYQAVERKVGPMFAHRGLVLVPDLATADLMATIECRVRDGSPDMTDLVVRDVSANSFVGRTQAMPSLSEFPTLRAVESEQAKAIEGFSRPGID